MSQQGDSDSKVVIAERAGGVGLFGISRESTNILHHCLEGTQPVQV